MFGGVNIISKTLYIPRRKSLGAELLRECSPPTMCQISHITCHLSHVMCHVSCVTRHVSHVAHKKMPNNLVELVGGGSFINGAYPV